MMINDVNFDGLLVTSTKELINDGNYKSEILCCPKSTDTSAIDTTDRSEIIDDNLISDIMSYDHLNSKKDTHLDKFIDLLIFLNRG